MFKLSLVTVNYNSSEYTNILLNSLVTSSSFFDKIVIVDNASSNEQIILLKSIVSKISVNSDLDISIVLSDENLGYFGGLNLGLSTVNKKNINGVIVCNNDLSFKEGFFYKLGLKSLDSSVYAVCPSVKTIDDIYQNPSMSNRPSFLRMFFYDLYYSNFYFGSCLLRLWRSLGVGADSRNLKDSEEKEIFIGIGAIYFLTNSYFMKNKMLPNDTFLYGEEAFLAKQIKDSGGIKLYYPDLEVTHFESVSTNKLPSITKYKLSRESYKKYRAFFKQKI